MVSIGSSGCFYMCTYAAVVLAVRRTRDGAAGVDLEVGRSEAGKGSRDGSDGSRAEKHIE